LKTIIIIIAIVLNLGGVLAQKEWRMIDGTTFDTVTVKQQPNTVYVLYKGPACTDCFRQINKVVKHLNQEYKSNLKIVGFLNSGYTVLSQKSGLKHIDHLLKADEYYFEIVEKNDSLQRLRKNGVFNSFPKAYYPTVIFHNGKKEIVVPYMDMFAEGVDLYSVLKDVFIGKKVSNIKSQK
jgi:hypothetical protein